MHVLKRDDCVFTEAKKINDFPRGAVNPERFLFETRLDLYLSQRLERQSDGAVPVEAKTLSECNLALAAIHYTRLTVTLPVCAWDNAIMVRAIFGYVAQVQGQTIDRPSSMVDG